ncbi:MAG: ribosome-recycling factor [Candidatus Dojkabacteria bacterium]|nr:MAG: ribosome-recycling factor [Candidatus Dojkabacteria bacterium]
MSINELKDKANKAVAYFEDSLKTLRAGRATTGLVENIPVMAYGSKVPLIQLATLATPEPRLITISVWDKTLIDAIVHALNTSDLGINPVVDGSVIRLNIPPMTEERRKEMVKVVWKKAEEAKIVIRNLRKDYLRMLKKRASDEKWPEDQLKKEEDLVDAEIKSYNEKIDAIAERKESEIMSI